MRNDGILVVDLRRVLADTSEVLNDSSPVKLVGIGCTALCGLCELEQVRYRRPTVLDLVTLLCFGCLLLLHFFLLITQHPSPNTLERVLAFEEWRRERYGRCHYDALPPMCLLCHMCCILIIVLIDADIWILTGHLAREVRVGI